MATARSKRLVDWVKKNRNITALAADIGLSESGLRRLLIADTIPTRRHLQFVQQGFPESLLPKAVDIKPGKKTIIPQRENSQPAQATA